MKIKSSRIIIIIALILLAISTLIAASTPDFKTMFTSGTSSGPTSLGQLSLLLEDVRNADGYRYDAKDNLGIGLDTLKIIKKRNQNRYLGVYHHNVEGSFKIYLAESTDLLNWTQLVQLDSNASMPDIFEFPEGDFLLVYEKQNAGEVNSIRIRHYASFADLKNGDYRYQKNIPLTLSTISEGTPNIISVNKEPFDKKNNNQNWTNSTIKLGFHFYTTEGTDRNATGVLTNFKDWSTTINTKINNYFKSRSFGGNFGDRDDFKYNNIDYVIYEAQLVKDRWESWRPTLYDSTNNVYKPLDIYTHQRSISFGNPTISFIVLPDGTSGVFTSYYIFSEGAKPGEAGPLIFFSRLNKYTSATPKANRENFDFTYFSPVCTCKTPQGRTPNNGFICNNGDSRYCATDEYCTNSAIRPSWPCQKI